MPLIYVSTALSGITKITGTKYNAMPAIATAMHLSSSG